MTLRADRITIIDFFILSDNFSQIYGFNLFYAISEEAHEEMKVWMQDHINDDELKHRGIEIMENTMKKFKEGKNPN